MNLENSNVIVTILTSTVFAALLTSAVNVILTLINNRKLKNFENDKHKNELISYRYTQLFSILLKWNEYTSPCETNGKSISEIASDKLVNGFIDNSNRLKLIIPLLDSCYKKRLEIVQKKGNDLLMQLIDLENQMDINLDGKLLEEHKTVFNDFKKSALDFSDEMNCVINEQLEILLEKNNKDEISWRIIYNTKC